jgi:hypothetical protein
MWLLVSVGELGSCADCCPEGGHDLWRLCGSSEKGDCQAGWLVFFWMDMSMHAKLYQPMHGICRIGFKSSFKL